MSRLTSACKMSGLLQRCATCSIRNVYSVIGGSASAPGAFVTLGLQIPGRDVFAEVLKPSFIPYSCISGHHTLNTKWLAFKATTLDA